MSVRRSAGGVWIEKRKKKDMSLILCIETGTDICSVGLARDGELISLRESDQGRDHARQVGVFVDELLSQTGIAPEELDAVAVGKGPGSYTGLRIGVSFAKGLCYGLRIPLVAIGSLDALTEVAKEDYEAGISRSIAGRRRASARWWTPAAWRFIPGYSMLRELLFRTYPPRSLRRRVSRHGAETDVLS